MKVIIFIIAWVSAEMANEYWGKENYPCSMLFICVTVWLAYKLFGG